MKILFKQTFCFPSYLVCAILIHLTWYNVRKWNQFLIQPSKELIEYIFQNVKITFQR